MAKLYFRYGAMNSGKSTALMQVAHNYEEQGMQVLILKPQVDTKGGDELVRSEEHTSELQSLKRISYAVSLIGRAHV